MRVIEADAGPIAAAAPAAIATAQAVTGGTPLTLNTNASIGIAAAGLGSPQLVPTSVYSFQAAGIPASQLLVLPYVRSGGKVTLTGNASTTAENFTIVGLDRYGNAISEVLAGPVGATTVSSNLIYGAVISITPASTNAGTISAGYAADSYTRWVALANFHNVYNVTANVSWGAGVTATYVIEATDYSMNTPPNLTYGETPPNIGTILASGTAQNVALTSGATLGAPMAVGGSLVFPAFIRAHFTSLTGGLGKLRVIPNSTV